MSWTLVDITVTRGGIREAGLTSISPGFDAARAEQSNTLI